MFCETPSVPVFCNVLWASRDEALAAPRGDMRLGFCPTCGHVYNLDFDEAALTYSPDYENSLHHSPHFQRYAEDLARRLVETYELREKDIIEVGCGKGHFLALLCAAGANRGLGFDASFDPARLGPAAEGLTVIRDNYTEAYRDHTADFIVCRHVLEHIATPRPFVRWVQEAARSRLGAAIYFEVPNALFTLADLGIWDLIYEHVSYFTPHSMSRLFREAGFSLRALESTYGNQFLYLEARAEGPEDVLPVPGPNIEALHEMVKAFGRHRSAKVAHWAQRLHEMKRRGQRVAIWGTGSKGVTFLNAVEGASDLAAVIDLNPHKHGRHVPGTGHAVTPPTAHTAGTLDVVLVMNPVYEAEIATQLRALGHEAQVLVV